MTKKNSLCRTPLPPLSEDVVVTRAEFAARLRISLSTLHRWVASGRIPPPVRIGGRHTVWPSAVVRNTLWELTKGAEGEYTFAPSLIVRRDLTK
ncbi:helix-turn-helix transcriptional regulator [Eoetvoesiella caeni]